MPDATTAAPSVAAPLDHAVHDVDGLRKRLRVVDERGWNSSEATALLELVFAEVVRPVVRSLGLYGAQARQAEATGWSTAWEALRRPSLREAGSPWGVLWVAVRRAVLGEKLAGDYLTVERTAWRLRGRSGDDTRPVGGRVPRPVSWDAVTACGREVFGPERSAENDGGVIGHLVGAFAAAGWPPGLARRLVRQIAVTAPPYAERPDAAFGWRHLAVELDIAPWQARRATVAVLGLPGRPGLAERVVRQGPRVLRTRTARWEIDSTLHYRRRTAMLA